MKYNVQIRLIDGKAVATMGPFSFRRAAIVASGAEINLNHEAYCVDIVDENGILVDGEPE